GAMRMLPIAGWTGRGWNAMGAPWAAGPWRTYGSIRCLSAGARKSGEEQARATARVSLALLALDHHVVLAALPVLGVGVGLRLRFLHEQRGEGNALVLDLFHGGRGHGDRRRGRPGCRSR